MRQFLLTRLAPVLAAALAVGVFVLVLAGRPVQPVELRAPQADTTTAATGPRFDPAAVRLRVMGGKGADDIAGLWPCFRGPKGDNISTEPVSLARTWPTGGPKALWNIDVGEGYAAPAIRNGRAYVLDYDPPDQWLVSDDEITDYKALGEWVTSRDKATPAPGKKELLALLSPGESDIRTVLTATDDPASKKALLTRLNALLDMPDLFRHFPLADLPLPPEANRYVVETGKDANKPAALRLTITPAETLRLNRILVESILGNLLAKSRHADVLRCLSLADGKDLWRLSYPVKVVPDHGVSRTVPAVTDQYVVTLGPKCHLVCADAKTGKFLWGVDLVAQYKTEVPLWYAGQCPIIDGDRVIVAPGGSSLVVALNLADGKVVWETPNPRRWCMTHSTLAIQELGGKRMYVYCGGNNVHGGVIGVDAATGAVLWETDLWKITTTIAAPICLPDGRVFLSGGYGAGAMMLRVVPDGDKFKAEQVWRLKPEDYGSVQQTPILWQDCIYGTRPDGQLACLDLDGNVKWTSGSAAKFGQALGPYMIADGVMFLMDDIGNLTLAQVSPQGYKQLAKARVLQGHDSWGPMAIVAGRLIVRDLTRMVCLDVRPDAGQ
jgi:outer membrane protein assembly factor BamB